MRMHRFHTTLSKWTTGRPASACEVQGLKRTER
jgi:hypothetical protein